MGIRYIAAPLDSDVIEWLDELEIPYPDHNRARHPTPREIRSALSLLPDCELQENGDPGSSHWQVMIESSEEHHPWTLLKTDPMGMDTPCQVSFEKGWPELIAQILLRLAHNTGPMALIPDTGDAPLVIHPGMDLDKALGHWELTLKKQNCEAQE